MLFFQSGQLIVAYYDFKKAAMVKSVDMLFLGSSAKTSQEGVLEHLDSSLSGRFSSSIKY